MCSRARRFLILSFHPAVSGQAPIHLLLTTSSFAPHADDNVSISSFLRSRIQCRSKLILDHLSPIPHHSSYRLRPCLACLILGNPFIELRPRPCTSYTCLHARERNSLPPEEPNDSHQFDRLSHFLDLTRSLVGRLAHSFRFRWDPATATLRFASSSKDGAFGFC